MHHVYLFRSVRIADAPPLNLLTVSLLQVYVFYDSRNQPFKICHTPFTVCSIRGATSFVIPEIKSTEYMDSGHGDKDFRCVLLPMMNA